MENKNLAKAKCVLQRNKCVTPDSANLASLYDMILDDNCISSQLRSQEYNISGQVIYSNYATQAVN